MGGKEFLYLLLLCLVIATPLFLGRMELTGRRFMALYQNIRIINPVDQLACFENTACNNSN